MSIASLSDYYRFNMVNNHNKFGYKSRFIDRIKLVYKKRYNYDYSDDELDILFCWTVNNKTRHDRAEDYTTKINEVTIYTGLDLIEYITQQYIYRNNGEPTIEFENLLEWDGFINKLDYNIFYAAYLVLNNIDVHKKVNHSLYINHDEKGIKNILLKGISENHMHLKGSGYTIDWSWVCFVMESFNNLTLFSDCLCDVLYSRTDKELRNINLAYSKLRVLHFYIWSLKNTEDHGYSFKSEEIYDVMNMNEIEFRSLNLITNIKINPDCENPDCKNYSLIDKLKFWQKDFSNFLDENKGDPLAPIIAQRITYSNIFNNKHGDNAIGDNNFLFNCYIMGVNQFKLNLIHDNQSTGFAQFKVHEESKDVFMEKSSYFTDKGQLNSIIYRTVFDKYYRDKNVEMVEFRVSPLNMEKLIHLVKKLDEVNEEVFEFHKNNLSLDPNRKIIKYGIICHYIKSNDQYDEDSLFQRHYKDRLRLERSYQTIRTLYENDSHLNKFIEDVDKTYQSDVIDSNLNIIIRNKTKSKRKTKNYYISKLVGIDTANYELNSRPYLFESIYSGHKKLNQSKSDLSFTYHVGEDFNTLVNGIRAIDDVIEFLDYKRGDRFGHAIALGLDVDKYFEFKRNKIHTSIEEYLDDIAWMFSKITSNDNGNLSNYLINEFEKYKQDLLPGELHFISIHDYIRAYKKRGKLIKFKATDHDSHQNENTSSAILSCDILTHYYEHNLEYKKHANKKLIIETSENYIKCVKLVQNILWEKIISKGIDIETNPSSNYKISYLRKRIELPLFYFNTKGLKHNPKGNLSVSINTDDSALFQTSLSLEYALVAVTLLKEGFIMTEIYDYIEHLRISSIQQSFLVDKNI